MDETPGANEPYAEQTPFLDNPNPIRPKPDKSMTRTDNDVETAVDTTDECVKIVTFDIQDSTTKTPTATQTPPRRTGPIAILKEVFDFRVLKRIDSLFIVFEGLLCFLGLMSFMLFLPGILLEKGHEGYDNASLLSIMGLGDLFGRIGSGVVADLKVIRRYRLEAFSALFAGLVVAACLFVNSYEGLAVLCTFYGVCSGGYIALFAPVVLDIVGPERMAKNYAIGLFLQGMGGAAGQPTLGYLKDTTGSYASVMVFCSVCSIMGAVILLCYPIAAKWDKVLQEKALERSRAAE